MTFAHEKRLLQAAMVLGVCVPIIAGASGAFKGALLLAPEIGSVDMDSHFRYLSGLLFGIGLGFLSAVPDIERQNGKCQLLTLIVFIGGVARLSGILFEGLPGKPMLAGLAMELVITPLLCWWQYRLSRRVAAGRF